MKLEDFDFDLPSHLIAQYPLKERTSSKLLCLNGKTGEITHTAFKDILEKLKSNDLLIFNDTKVIPARLFAQKPTGGKVEILIERILNEHEALAQLKANKTLKLGTKLSLSDSCSAIIAEKPNDFILLKFNLTEKYKDIMSFLKINGHIPLPPYINRNDTELDQNRYQTVYAKHEGAVAAPTAGLHFDNSLMQKITAKGINIAFLTLHVGAGTFKPVRTNDIKHHKMHTEYFAIGTELCEKIAKTRKSGGRIIAVGTTCVRSLEAAAIDADAQGNIAPFSGETDIFIYPGYKFGIVDAIITNFHLPKSTLFMLICAFAGHTKVMHAYKEAIAMQYRFFSYGDAMFITKET